MLGPTVLFKLIAIAFVAGSAGRVLFGWRLKGMGQWFRRFIDLTLLLLVIVFGLQLLLLALR